MKVPLTNDQLIQHLVDQLTFLGNSARLFDEGYRREAVRMAAQLRILFHQSSNSKALLFQLNLQDFLIKSAISITREELKEQESFHGYGKAEVVGDRFLSLGPDLSTQFFDELPLEKWWRQPIWKLNEGTIITREDLILNAANTDGGAHVDPAVKDVYAAFAAPGAGGWYLRGTKRGAVLEYSEDAHLVALREIAHEVLQSPWENVPGVSPRVSWYRGPVDPSSGEAASTLRKTLERHFAG